MKYKKIITDNELPKKLKKVNKTKIARKIGITKGAIYEAISEKYVLSEITYRKIKEEVERKLNE